MSLIKIREDLIINSNYIREIGEHRIDDTVFILISTEFDIIKIDNMGIADFEKISYSQGLEILDFTKHENLVHKKLHKELPNK